MRDPILKDVRVRRALSHAIDRHAIIEYLRRGLAIPAVGMLPADVLGIQSRRAGLRLRPRQGPRAARRGGLSRSGRRRPARRAAPHAQDLDQRVLPASGDGDPAAAAGGGRGRRGPHVRVRDALRGRIERQLPDVLAAMGRRRRRGSRHPAPRLPLESGAARQASTAVTSAIRASIARSTTPRGRPTKRSGASCSERHSGSSRSRSRTSASGARRTRSSLNAISPTSTSRRRRTSSSSKTSRLTPA